MGISSRIDIRNSLVSPDTPPPEAGSPSTVAYGAKVAEERSWKAVVPISPPMSNHDQTVQPDMSSRRASGEADRRDESFQTGSRQQLPSLSSLFGPPNRMRPIHSPLSDRPSPMRSPLDRPASASAVRDRSHSSSYFPSTITTTTTAPAAQPRSIYEPRIDADRQPLPSTTPRFPGPLSPRNWEYDQAQPMQRQDSSTSSTRWSSQSSHLDLRRPEYVFGSHETAPSFRPVNIERPPFPPLTHKSSRESLPSYRDQQPPAPAPASSHRPISLAGASEGAPSKDGLGPKIWTGTHFLPRFLRQAEIPGEGLCYFYDDGTHCKSIIDGEQVNAHWGVTKAGKPRKRLAIACLTCREKKIKCDPDFPRCVQCEKFGRQCKFKNAPRGGHNGSPATSPGTHEESRHLGPPAPASVEQNRPRSISSASVSPRTTALPHPSPDLPGISAKRMRVSYEPYKSSTQEPAALYRSSEVAEKPPAPSWHQRQHTHQRDLPRVHEDLLCQRWPTDSRSHAPL
ncbi:hypothetical protein BX600DRAFT_291901 [Xylariales sp. PMI_506]|nr:hypothetical protein BX600DRAFT_291901 [Xylariales sp. PMI_506]